MTTTEPRSSWDLVTAAQAGDSDAFGQLWTRYQPQIYRYIARKVRNRSTAEDLTGDTFLKAFQAIRTISDHGRDVGAWLVTIARNNVLDHRKSAHTRHSAPVGDLYFWEVHKQLPGPDITVPQQRCEADAADRLQRMLTRLPASQQAAIRNRYWNEHPAAESAELMGCTVPAMKMLQQRGVRNLARAARPARTVVEFTDGTAA